MAEGLKLVNDIFARAIWQHEAGLYDYPGINLAVLVLSDPENQDLWKRMKTYCEEEQGDDDGN